jgi:predicted Rossmann fold nucleotide-binding protein DprA/Smf involved in DNA uptake
MTPAPVPLPPQLVSHLSVGAAVHLIGVGEVSLLAEPLLGLIASRQCPGHVFIETLDRVPQWIRDQRVLISGFHSPLEQQVLRSLLRRQGCAIKVLARTFGANYRPQPDEQTALAERRLLILSACLPNVTRITRASSLERNRLVQQLAAELHAPHIRPDSPLVEILKKTSDSKNCREN